MKQHITGQQYNELSEKGEERLCQWNEERGGVYDVQNLSIGQMIEFLSEWGMIGIQKTLFDKKWTVDFPMYFLGKKEKELCDALWEAVKEVLEL